MYDVSPELPVDQDSIEAQEHVASENSDERHSGEIINLGSRTVYSDEHGVPIAKANGIRMFYKSDFRHRKSMESTGYWCIMEAATLRFTGENVVIKFINRGQEKLRREAEVSALLPKHENVLELLGEFHDSDKLGFVSLRQDGNLLDLVKRKPCTEIEFIDISIQMGRGLAVLHENNVLHRDVALRNFLFKSRDVALRDLLVKPRNLHERFCPMNIKICDFGLSRVGSHQGRYICSPDSIIPCEHQAPEVLGDRKHEARCDVYAFGITLWELWSGGKTPFSDDHDITNNYSQFVKNMSCCDNGGEKLCMYGIPKDIQDLISSCTKISPGLRPTIQGAVAHLEEKKQSQMKKLKMTSSYTTASIMAIEKINVALMQKHGKEKKESEALPKAMPQTKNSVDDEKYRENPPEKPQDKNSKSVIFTDETKEHVTENPAKSATIIPTESVHGTENGGDQSIKEFFQEVLKPRSGTCKNDVKKYADACLELGIERKSQLRDYFNLVRYASEVIRDGMKFKKVHLFNVLNALFDSDKTQDKIDLLKSSCLRPSRNRASASSS